MLIDRLRPLASKGKSLMSCSPLTGHECFQQSSIGIGDGVEVWGVNKQPLLSHGYFAEMAVLRMCSRRATLMCVW